MGRKVGEGKARRLRVLEGEGMGLDKEEEVRGREGKERRTPPVFFNASLFGFSRIKPAKLSAHFVASNVF